MSWLWNQEDSGAAQVQARFRPAHGRWEPIATVGPPEARDPVSAIDGAGRATVVYVGNRARPRAVTHSAEGWGTPVRLGTHGVDVPDVAAGPGGDVVVTFAASVDQTYRAEAVHGTAGGGWTEPVPLEGPTAPVTVSDPVVDVDAAGVATAAWWHSDQSVVSARTQADGSWSTPEVVAPPGATVLPQAPFLDLAVSPSGTVLLTWTRRTAGGSWVGTALRDGTGWAVTEPVSTTDQHCAAGEPAVRAGVAVLAWRCDTGTGDLVQLADLTG